MVRGLNVSGSNRLMSRDWGLGAEYAGVTRVSIASETAALSSGIVLSVLPSLIPLSPKYTSSCHYMCKPAQGDR